MPCSALFVLDRCARSLELRKRGRQTPCTWSWSLGRLFACTTAGTRPLPALFLSFLTSRLLCLARCAALVELSRSGLLWRSLGGFFPGKTRRAEGDSGCRIGFELAGLGGRREDGTVSGQQPLDWLQCEDVVALVLAGLLPQFTCHEEAAEAAIYEEPPEVAAHFAITSLGGVPQWFPALHSIAASQP